ALIHAATMVAAGVFLVARCHPIFALDGAQSVALTATAWIGGITALYAALVAVAQYDFKRILAYSTVSQLGFMMVALGTGGVAAGMFHLIAHAFFKALLFLSAGSVIHGCHGEQDIRRMGGLSGPMRSTFLVYAVGMLALSGFPFLFSGFWSKEAIFHSAHAWEGGQGPFVLVLCAALMTAFYMTRQAVLVFLTPARASAAEHAHESPKVMLVPLFVLATFAVLLSLIGTPVWPWFEEWIHGGEAHFHFAALWAHGGWILIAASLVIFTVGVSASWSIYRKVKTDSGRAEPLSARFGKLWPFLERAMGFDDLYRKCIIEPLAFLAGGVDMLERIVMVPLMGVGEAVVKSLGAFARGTDEFALNGGFNRICDALKRQAANTSAGLSGRPQSYLRTIGLTMSVLLIVYLWFASR
ncbi:MAG TPA: proton-conducting transporter membrane subunit, partial [Luteolibacter sp.]|nr:proton-conducting transporter membrane subunit [Luteolibacter sp.]